MPPWGSGHLLPAADGDAEPANASRRTCQGPAPAESDGALTLTGHALTGTSFLVLVFYIPVPVLDLVLPKCSTRGGFSTPQGRGRASDLAQYDTRDELDHWY